MNLNAYLARIGYTGSTAPTLETLAEMVFRHSERIPFENLNPLMGWPVRLDTDSLEQKLVFGNRGGYCYEQNLLLKNALDAMGFRVTGLAARVLWDVPPDRDAPRTHMLLRVDIDLQAYMVDVGFGAMSPTGVLRLEPDLEQQTPLETFRLTRRDDGFLLEGRGGEDWRALYRFDLQPQTLADYEVANWYVSTFPDSHFRHELLVARVGQGRRFTLHNTELTVRPVNGAAEKQTLRSASELRDALESVFGLRLPQAPELDRLIESRCRAEALRSLKAALHEHQNARRSANCS